MCIWHASMVIADKAQFDNIFIDCDKSFDMVDPQVLQKGLEEFEEFYIFTKISGC